MENKKVCKDCGETKSVEEFSIKYYNKDGRALRCRNCCAIRKGLIPIEPPISYEEACMRIRRMLDFRHLMDARIEEREEIKI